MDRMPVPFLTIGAAPTRSRACATPWLLLAAALAASLPCGPALAQSGDADIEAGVTTAGSTELGMDSNSGRSTSSAPAAYYPRSTRSGGVRLGLQARLDAINVIDAADTVPGSDNAAGSQLFVPIVTPGVRFLDDRLFLGLGLGFQGVSVDDANGTDSTSRSGFGLAPLAGYDVLADDTAALSLLGWLNFASLGETEDCDPDCSDANDDATAVGLTLAAGLRGKLSPALAIGGEFGWGFLSISEDAGDDIFVHGIIGTILFEASIGI